MTYRERTAPLVGPKTHTEADWRENARRLADFLDTVPDEQVTMRSWVRTIQPLHATRPACGTAACAFGWAMLSGVIPGLSWVLDDEVARWPARPVIDGDTEARVQFPYAACKFFGRQVYDSVFMETGHTRTGVISRLRQYAGGGDLGASESLHALA